MAESMACSRGPVTRGRRIARLGVYAVWCAVTVLAVSGYAQDLGVDQWPTASTGV